MTRPLHVGAYDVAPVMLWLQFCDDAALRCVIVPAVPADMGAGRGVSCAVANARTAINHGFLCGCVTRVNNCGNFATLQIICVASA